MSGFQIAVRVPGPCSAIAAMKDLHEPYAALNHTRRRQALLAKILGLFFIQAVQLLRLFRFFGKPYDVRNGRLHAKGEFVGFDPRCCGLVFGIFDSGRAVELVEQLKLSALFFVVDILAGSGKRQWVFGINVQLHPVVRRAEITGAMSAHPAATIGDRLSHDYKLRQVIVQRAEAVMRPGADSGEFPFKTVTAGVELVLRPVIIVGRPHRPHDGHVVDAVPQVRPPVGHLDPRFPTFFKSNLQWIQFVADVSVGIIGDDNP